MAQEKVTEQTNGEFWDNYEPPTNFLTREQRANLVKSRTQIHIVGVKTRDNGKYGPAWQFELDVPGFDTTMLLSLQKNDMRNDFAEQVQNYLRRNPNVGGIPVILATVRTEAGQQAYIFDNPRDPRGQAEINFTDLDDSYEDAAAYDDQVPF